jgi:3-dehydroquinate synthase
VLTEPIVYEHVYLPIKDFLPEHVLILVPGGESAKNLETAGMIWQKLQHHTADRHSLMLNLGGGMITDLGGFAASVYARGIRFIHMPTSLLAMADASIGGKTGINFMGIKNQLGSFCDPYRIWIEPNFLKTLPQREYKAGMAEIYKIHILQSIRKINTRDFDEQLQISLLLANAMNYKDSVCKKDPLEKGIRASLNLGHTIGHALESWSQDKPVPLLHGEAVALGLIVELELLVKHKYCKKAFAQNHIRQLQKWAPALSLSKHDAEEICRICKYDKKNLYGFINITSIREGIGFSGLLNVEEKEMEDVLILCFGKKTKKK